MITIFLRASARHIRTSAKRSPIKKIDWGESAAFRHASTVLFTNNGDKLVYGIAYFAAASCSIFFLNFAHLAYTELRSEGFVYLSIL